MKQEPDCPECGKAVPIGTAFCANCGSAVGTALIVDEKATSKSGGRKRKKRSKSGAGASVASSATQRMTGPGQRGSQRSSAVQAQMMEALRAATLGDYEIVAELGRGGMATVYLAHDISLDRKVAIKVMSPALLDGEGAIERFKREARTAGGLSHPHIIPIHAVRESGNLLYFVMKYVDGRPLDSVIKSRGKLPIAMVVQILFEVAGALAYAHRKGVVHRDVKPSNIMLDDDGWAVVTDFGIAKVVQKQGLTMTGTTVGTPAYMSPEQCMAREVTGRSDQYSLGIVAFELLAGRVPFRAESLMEMLLAHANNTPPPLLEARPDCPPRLTEIVEKMMAKAPEHRWASLEDVASALAPLHQSDTRERTRNSMIRLARESHGRVRADDFARPVSPTPRNSMARSSERAATTAALREDEPPKGGIHLWFWAAILVPLLAAGAWLAVQWRGWGGTSGTAPSGVTAPVAAPEDTSIALAGAADNIRVSTDSAPPAPRDSSR